MLPPDNHVHSEWSWDAVTGSMERTCAQAVQLGLPYVAFTEHADFTQCNVPDDVELPEWWLRQAVGDVMIPPELDVDNYLACLQECRKKHHPLLVLSGVELSEPHWHRRRVAELLNKTKFDRILASVHSLPVDAGYEELPGLYRTLPAADVIRTYLTEVDRMIRAFDGFEVLAHIDYPVRYWPDSVGQYRTEMFETEYRMVLSTLATANKALELNTRVPLTPAILRWWREEGGEAVTFASDAHQPEMLAHGFAEAAAMAEGCGFRPGPRVYDFWRRA